MSVSTLLLGWRGGVLTGVVVLDCSKLDVVAWLVSGSYSCSLVLVVEYDCVRFWRVAGLFNGFNGWELNVIP